MISICQHCSATALDRILRARANLGGTKMHRILVVGAMALGASALAACGSLGKPPATPGDPRDAPAYGYTPIDPLPVTVVAKKPPATNAALLAALPDETMRLAIGEVSGKGAIAYGPAKIGYAGSSYVAILDYVKFDTRSLGFKASPPVDAQPAIYSLVSEQDPVRPDAIVPAYVGVGLRLTASVTVNQGSVDLGNLLAIGVAAEAKRAAGTLVIQTLGITGPGISSALPLPSEINTTTIQNALVALGTIKAKLYDDQTTITPQVVGVYNTVGGGQEIVNGFISAILEHPLRLEIP